MPLDSPSHSSQITSTSLCGGVGALAARLPDHRHSPALEAATQHRDGQLRDHRRGHALERDCPDGPAEAGLLPGGGQHGPRWVRFSFTIYKRVF